jgi:hypothetical protein
MKKRFSRYATASVMSLVKPGILADNDVGYRKMLLLEPINTLHQGRLQNRFEVQHGLTLQARSLRSPGLFSEQLDLRPPDSRR